jgi:hypothetical protein
MRKLSSATRETWGRIFRTVRGWENSGRSQPPVSYHGHGDDSDGVLCKTTAAWTKGTTATLQIWTGAPGSEANTGVTLDAYNRYANIASGKFCTVMLHRHGYYYVIAAECS